MNVVLTHYLTEIAEQARVLVSAPSAPEVETANPKFGADFAIACFKLAAQMKANPAEMASVIAAGLSHPALAKAEAMGGFVNLWLNDTVIADAAVSAVSVRPSTNKGKVIVTEYSDPNPFKALHAGHLYTTIVGDVISRLLEVSGGDVHRVNFGGDVGLHVGKAMWGLFSKNKSEAATRSYVEQELARLSLHERASAIAACYVAANKAYETDPVAKAAIIDMNKKVYQLHDTDDHDSDFAYVYWTCREWSYQYFNEFYQQLGVTPFEKYYPESQTSKIGVATVTDQLAKGVYQKSDGAVVFAGEPYGLHTRVFINSQGLPTYEAKDVGVSIAKWNDYHFDKSFIITGDDIIDYMRVVLKSIEQFAPELARNTWHITHGQVKLEGGVKMSSRKGNGLAALEILQAAEDAVHESRGAADRQTAYAAVKYAFLRQRIGGDIIYIPKESVSLEGNSGPYLQYAHARACSLLAKAAAQPAEASASGLQPDERAFAMSIAQYPAVVQRAVNELMPHYICTYLYELAQAFNRFYERNRVVGDPRQAARVPLVTAYRSVLADGLSLLGITAPDQL